MKRLLFHFIFMMAFGQVHSQFMVTGTDPASLRWEQIFTPHFRVIYPVTFQKHAQYIANGLEFFHEASGRTLSSSVSGVPVIFHDRTTIPSSSTLYAPFRMDFFTAPPQDIYAMDWIDQLILHELRHANQFTAINKGFTKGLSRVLGEQAVLAMTGIFTPLWMIEGDATLAETSFCSTGRGRVPSFEMKIKAQFIEKGVYSYEKAVNRSFRDYVPGPYELGYFLTAAGRMKYGAEIWGSALENAGRKPYTLTPFSSALKKRSGSDKYGLYSEITQSLKERWTTADRLLAVSGFEQVSLPRQDRYTSYAMPQIIRDSLIIAIKSIFGELPQIVLIDSMKREKVLFMPGYNYMPESMSVSDSLVYWSEMTNDPRWTLRDYRVIKAYNFNTGKIRQLTRGTRFYAPSVSPDGQYIAAVEVTVYNQYFLVILQASDSKIIRKIEVPENHLFIHPRWSEDGKRIVSVVFGNQGNSIAIIDPENGDYSLLLPYTDMEIKRPSFMGTFVIYTASYDGTDNIYAVETQTGEIHRVTTARFGATDAVVMPDGKTILYADYTSDGYRLVKAKPEIDRKTKFTIPAVSPFPMAEAITEQENFQFNKKDVPGNKYPVKPYRKGLNLFHFHSWIPAGIDLQNTEASPGVTLLSQNLLGTAVTSLSYLRDRNQETGKYQATISYEGLYPAIDFEASHEGRRYEMQDSQGKTVTMKWNESSAKAGIRLPLRWTHNLWERKLQPGAKIGFKAFNVPGKSLFQFTEKSITSASGSLFFSNSMKTSPRDIIPKWAQEISAGFERSLNGEGINSIWSTSAMLMLRGVGPHHGIRLYGGWQHSREDYYRFTDHILLPRGYHRIYGEEIITSSAAYYMPLFYTDWHIGHIVNFRRFKTSIFIDYAESYTGKITHHYTSTGVDMNADLNIFNMMTPFDIGIRSYYKPEENKVGVEFLFSILLGSLYE